jgi:hypothetical protein
MEMPIKNVIFQREVLMLKSKVGSGDVALCRALLSWCKAPGLIPSTAINQSSLKLTNLIQRHHFANEDTEIFQEH